MERLLFQILIFYVICISNIAVISQVQSVRPMAEIRVSTNGQDIPECLTNASVPCQSVYYAMMNIGKLISTRIILESGSHSLNSTIELNALDGLELVGDNRTDIQPVILCTDKDSGLRFNRSINLYFSWFILENCGAEFPSTSMLNNTRKNITTALHLTECKNVITENVEIRNSSGAGAVFYDVNGFVRFNNVVFSNNKQKQGSAKQVNGSTSGGGIYIEFRPADGDGNVFNSHGYYVFNNCKFLDNVAEHEHSVISESKGNNFFSFGRGGGISFIARGKSNGNTLAVNSCIFERNKALWGAGIFIEIDDESGNHVINVTGTKFCGNNATMAGGGIRIGVNVHGQSEEIRLNIINTNFSDNTAKIGGGFSQYRPSNDKREENRVLIDNCVFVRNRAFIGTSIHIQHINIILQDSSILYDKKGFDNEKIQGQGALYCYSTNITLWGHNRIVGNRFTGFVLDACLIFLYNSSHFINNTGSKGGAMALYSHSVIRMTNGSKLFLHYNSALRNGGALYVETPVPTHNHLKSTELSIYKCFLQFGDYDGAHLHADQFNAKVYFKGNYAPEKHLGMAVWATTLAWCRERNEELYNNTVLNSWKTVDFAGDNPLTSVVSSPTLIHTEDSDWDAHPGIYFRPKITLKDENWNSIYGTLRVKLKPVENGSVIIPYSHVIVNNDPTMRFDGYLGAVYSLTLETDERYSVSKTISGRRLKKQCPPGFEYQPKINSCVCLDVSDGVSNCDMLKQSISILPGRWGNPKGGKHFVKHSCPRHYCRPCNETSLGCIYEPMRQCAKGRKQDSVLCGECEKDLSVRVGSEECTKCDNRAEGLYVILFILVITIFVLAVMLINLDTYSSYLNAFFYSYQIIPLITQDIIFDPFCSFIIGISNLSGFGRVQKGLCIGLQLNNMLKITLNYLIPTYIILCTVLFGALSYCIKRIPFNRNACFRAFVFLSVFAYSDYTKITFQLLKPVNIEGLIYVYHAAYMKYFGNEHAPYAACAIVVLLFIVLGFPAALLASHQITANAKLIKLKAIFDTFQEPFKAKPNFDVFPAFYFITRLVLLSIDSIVEHRSLHRATMGIACVLVVYIFTLFQPYRSQHMNYHDSLLLVNIAVIAVINVAMGEAFVTSDRKGLRVTVNVLAYIPFLCLSFRAFLWAVVKIKHWRAKKKGRTNSGRPLYRSARVPSRVREDNEDHPYKMFQDNAKAI